MIIIKRNLFLLLILSACRTESGKGSYPNQDPFSKNEVVKISEPNPKSQCAVPFPNPKVYPTKKDILNAYRYVCENDFHKKDPNSFTTHKYMVDGSTYQAPQVVDKEAILHIEPVLDESFYNDGHVNNLNVLLMERRIKATLKYNPSTGEYDTHAHVYAIDISPEVIEWKNRVLGPLQWVSGFAFSNVLFPPFLNSQIYSNVHKNGGFTHQAFVMGILAEHSPESPIVGIDLKGDDEWREFIKLSRSNSLNDQDKAHWHKRFTKRAQAFSKILKELNIGYINISGDVRNTEEEVKIAEPFFQALLNPSQALVFHAIPYNKVEASYLDFRKDFINRIQVAGYSNETEKEIALKKFEVADIFINTGNCGLIDKNIEFKRVYRLTNGFSTQAMDNHGSSFATPLAVSVAVWLRENEFSGEAWSEELVKKIHSKMVSQRIWQPLHECQTMGEYLGYITPRGDVCLLEELQLNEFKDWEEACRTLSNPNFKTTDEIKAMIEAYKQSH